MIPEYSHIFDNKLTYLAVYSYFTIIMLYTAITRVCVAGYSYFTEIIWLNAPTLPKYQAAYRASKAFSYIHYFL